VAKAAAHPDEAKTQRFEGTFSGSILPSTVDFDGDGIPAGAASIAGNSNMGAFVAQGLVDVTFGGPGLCPNGNPGVLLNGGPGTGGVVFRFHSGELLSAKVSSTHECFDLTNNVAILAIELEITGGTGRFVGAAGSVTVNADASVVAANAHGVGLS